MRGGAGSEVVAGVACGAEVGGGSGEWGVVGAWGFGAAVSGYCGMLALAWWVSAGAGSFAGDGGLGFGWERELLLGNQTLPA